MNWNQVKRYWTSLSDTLFVINYWKLSDDNRMIFGGGENYSRRFPSDIINFVKPKLLKIIRTSPILGSNTDGAGRWPSHSIECLILGLSKSGCSTRRDSQVMASLQLLWLASSLRMPFWATVATST